MIGVLVRIQKPTSLVLSACIAWAIAGCPNVLLADEPIKVGPTVVCFGDSITKRGYPSILGEQLGVKSLNAGIAGHTSREGLRRMEKDVLSHQPDVVVVFFGTNDLRVDAPKKYVELDEYKLNLEKMIRGCRARNAKVILCTLPPIESKTYFKRHEQKLFDDVGGLGQLVKNYRDAAADVAQQAEVPLVDLNQLLKDDPRWLSKDGVHPSKEGCRIIAKHIGSAVSTLLKKQEGNSETPTETPKADNIPNDKTQELSN